MSSEFLNYHLFKEDKIAEMALRRFSAAWRTGRLVVFAGSWVTQNMGYGSWDDLIRNYLADAIKELEEINIKRNTSSGIPPRELIELLEQIRKSHNDKIATGGIDQRVLASIAEHILRYVDEMAQLGGETGYRSLEKGTARRLMPKEQRGDPVVVKAIIEALGVERVLTLNYDLEFEWAMMAPHLAGQEAGRIAAKIFKQDVVPKDINDEWTIADLLGRDRRTHSLTKSLPGGQSIRSDVFLRERTDRLIEFAVGSPEYEGHVFHLHGRADFPESMVISLRDYDRMYRRSGITRLPFEHALKILFAGNPILCIGLGMNESEINNILQEFVADHPRSSFAQIFILWDEPDARKRQLLRYNWQQKLGAHALFVSDFTGSQPLQGRGRAARVQALQDSAKAILLHNAMAAMGVKNAKGRQLRIRKLQPAHKLALLQHPPVRRMPLDRQVKALADEAFKRLKPLELQNPKPQKGKEPTADFRSIATKLKSWNPKKKALKFWSKFEKKGIQSHNSNSWEKFVSGHETTFSENNTIVVHGPSARGKAQLASYLVDEIYGKKNVRRVLINCNFAFDVDAMLSGLSGVFTKKPCESKEIARARFWQPGGDSLWESGIAPDPAQKKEKDPPDPDQTNSSDCLAIIVFNDFDRFFDRAGLPLSSELDLLCRQIVLQSKNEKQTGKFRWVFIGTDRIKRYFNMLERPHLLQHESSAAVANGQSEKCANIAYVATGPKDGQDHFESIAKAFEDKEVGNTGLGHRIKELTDLDDPTRWILKRRATFADYLQPAALKTVIGDDHELALELLTVMAFIGQSVEPFVLAYAPRIRRFRNRGIKNAGGGNDSSEEGNFHERIGNLLEQLADLELVLKIENFQPSSDQHRYGLHRTVLAEMRDRLGVPLGEAKLATAFNLSLFAAQPTDSYNPDNDIHDELGQLVDFLVGAYKDVWREERQRPVPIKQIDWQRIQPHVSSCLRAALAVLRSYYSTAALVTFDVSGRAGDEEEDRPGPLTEHADRLERVIWAAEATIEARRKLPELTTDEGFTRTAPPFYPDDLVWLHNERGVAKMMQGDLYEARASFDAAQRLNASHVEFGYPGPNWIRIQLNQLAVDFERGRLKEVRARIDDIIASDLIGGHEALKAISAEYGTAAGARENSGKLRTVVSSRFTHDQLLAVGITTGYRAMVDMLGGRLETSHRRFLTALAILRNINEHRAYAMFSIHCSSLLNALRDRNSAVIMVETAIAVLQSSQQRDLANLAEVKEVWLEQYGKDGWNQNANLQKLRAVLEYAVSTDMHRVRVEARATLAHLKVKSGDFDSALEHAADAMAVATRFGMTLRKIALRNQLGQILIKRGDRFSGHALIDQAIREADRIGYQRAIERAQDIKAEEGKLIDRPDY